ncbi:Histone-lysine N-methyltransferase SETMAR-like [Oopsacas minuta]|uniref:Histone-lysine N-methyltransferase SETMAR-like n=1 Tax=Oopsacas minuta TaxID=111878 RepID=A0AAV7JZY5_9METZ|nr:Histone-lysine N-methyltransferase SETMAR-like [Oopsacas minuta]
MDFSKEGKRQIIWYLWKKRKTGSYILREMQDIFGDECPSKATIYRWIERFDNGDEELHDDPRPGRPIPQKPAKELRQAIKRERRGKLTLGVLLQHDNARPHVSSKTMIAIDDLGFECLPHPPYSPDLAPSDYWLFGEMKSPLRGRRFEDFERLEYEIKQCESGTSKSSMPLGWKSCQNDGNDV